MNSFDWKQFLQQHPVFSTVDKRRIDQLVDVSKENTYGKDEVIVRQDEIGDSLFVIGSGSAEASFDVGEGPPIPLSTMRSGGVFGEMAFFERRARTATVRAMEPCTVLEINGPEFQKLANEYPGTEVKLLLKMSERLRHANERILLLNLKTVDGKLKLFNNKLDAKDMAFEAQLKAAQAMFEQTKSRADEVIASAERSRDRLNKSATLVGTFVAALVGLAGLFGWSKVNDATKSVDSLEKRVADSVKSVESAKTEATKSQEEARKSVEEARKSVEQTNKLESDARKLIERVRGDLENLTADLTKSKIDIYLPRLHTALSKDSGWEAFKEYQALKAAGGLDGEQFGSLLLWMEEQVVAKAPQAPLTDQQKSNAESFIRLFQQAVADAKTPRDKLDAYYLLLVYAYLTNQTEFEEKVGELKNLAAARAALEKYVNSTPFKQYYKSAPNEEKQRTAARKLADRIKNEPGKRRDALRDLSNLAFVSLD